MRFAQPRPIAREIWYDDTDTSVLSIGSGARVDVAAFEPVTFDVKQGEVVYAEFLMPWNTHGVIGGIMRAFISDNTGADAAAVVKAAGYSSEARAVNSAVGQALARERIAVPGTYTRKPQIGASAASGAGAGMLASAVIRPHFIITARST